jgi:peptidyl-prolyl cis-trans isomerase B (cyclophilin B)
MFQLAAAFFVAAFAQDLSDKAKEAQKGIEDLRAMGKEIAEIQGALGKMKDDYAAAMKAGNQAAMDALRLDFSNKQAKFQELRGKIGPAAQALETRIDTDTKAAAEDLGLLGFRSQIREMLGKRPEARSDAESFLAKAKGPVELILQVAEVARRVEAFEVARKACAPLVKEHPGALATDALIAFATDDYESAVAGLEAALKEKEKLEESVRLEVERALPEAQIRLKESKANDNPRATISTTKGDMEVELYENQAPNTVANFISLTERKFFDGLKFHRVIPNFMVQGGDPAGNGSGGPGYAIKDEVGEGYRKHFRAVLSMANAGPDTNGSQFFVTHVATVHLDGKHTVYGRVLKGVDVVDKIEQGDTIKSVVVTRKRDHEYKVVKLGQ